MSATAKMNREWLVRMLIVAVGFTAFGCWCLYDGLIRYPRINAELEQAPALVAADAMQDQEHKTDADIRMQFIMAGGCFGFAAFLALRVLWASRRQLAADDVALHAINGDVVPYEHVLGIDKRRWDRKGIAVVRYRTNGRVRRTRIDDWIFKGGDAVLAEVERHAGPEDGPAVADSAAPDTDSHLDT